MAGPGLSAIVLAYIKAGALQAFQSAAELFKPGLALFNWVRSKMPGLTSTEASEIYQLGIASVNAGATQDTLPVGDALDPSQVPFDPELGLSIGPNDIVQYKVGARVFYPNLGRSQWLTVYVNSPDFLTEQDLWSEVGAAAEGLAGNYIDPANPGGDNSPSLIELKTKGVLRAR